MYCTGLKLRLKPEAYAGYKKAHDELWPELAKGMKQCRISMAIYRDGDSLFVFATAPTEADWHRSREDPVLDAWNESMAAFLETDGSGCLVCHKLENAFGFGDFA